MADIWSMLMGGSQGAPSAPVVPPGGAQLPPGTNVPPMPQVGAPGTVGPMAAPQGGFGALMSDPAVVQALLTGGAGLLGGGGVGQSMASALSAFNQARDKASRTEAAKAAAAQEQANWDKLFGLKEAEAAREGRKVDIQEEELQLAKEKGAAEIVKLKAEAAKARADAKGKAPKGVNKDLWNQALDTATAGAGAGEGITYADVAGIYNRLDPENKVLIDFTPDDLKQNVDYALANPQMYDQQRTIVAERFGDAAARRLDIAARQAQARKQNEAEEEAAKPGLFEGILPTAAARPSPYATAAEAQAANTQYAMDQLRAVLESQGPSYYTPFSNAMSRVTSYK